MPTLPLAVLVLLARFSLSQMDVPTRQSYVISVVDPDERSAAAGRHGHRPDDRGGDLAGPRRRRSSRAPGWRRVPFYLAGGLKILYDLLLYRAFTSGRAPDERAQARDGARRRPRWAGSAADPTALARGRPGIPSRHQTKSTTSSDRRRRAISRSNGWRAWRIASQFSPRTVPADTSRSTTGTRRPSSRR